MGGCVCHPFFGERIAALMAETAMITPASVRAQAGARVRLPPERKPPFRAVWQKHWRMYLMMMPAIILLLLFNAYPIWGIAIAFVDYNPFKGLAGSPFVGLEHFQRFFATPNAYNLFRNTLFISIGKIIAGQLVALVFALALNQVKVRFFHRAVQTATTLPHFLSWIIIGGIMVQALSTTGIVNKGIMALGFPAIRFLGDAALFPWTMIGLETWKEFGWGAVLYLAALTAINPELYEAAAVDGAGRWRREWHITLPGIAPMIILLTALSLGGILNAGFEQILVLINPVTYRTGDVLDTFVYREGLLAAKFSLGTAVGLFKSVIGLGMILFSWWLADRLANYRIF